MPYHYTTGSTMQQKADVWLRVRPAQLFGENASPDGLHVLSMSCVQTRSRVSPRRPTPAKVKEMQEKEMKLRRLPKMLKLRHKRYSKKLKLLQLTD